MNAIPESFGVKSAPQKQLGLRVLASNASHHARPGLFVYINHWHSSFACGRVRIGAGI
jgi:hypothetical protein